MSERTSSLDGLRGLAAVQVFNQHYGLAKRLGFDGPSFIESLIRQVLVGNRIAVSLFFVLSGRVVALSVLKSPTIENVARSIFKRPIRFAIPVFGQLLVHWLFGRLKLFPTTETNNLVPTLSSAFFVTLKLFFGGEALDVANTGQRVTWTMPIELYSGIFTVIIAAIAQRVKSKQMLYTFAICLTMLANSHLSSFIIGLTIAEFRQQLKSLQRFPLKMLHIALSLILLSQLFFPNQMEIAIDGFFRQFQWNGRNFGVC